MGERQSKRIALALVAACVPCLASLAPAQPLPAESPPKPQYIRATNAVINGEMFTGINRVKASPSGRITIIHNAGVASVRREKLSNMFLLGWGIDPETLASLPSATATPVENVTHNNLPDVRPDGSFDPWTEIWAEFPKLSVRQMAEKTKLPPDESMIRLTGHMGTLYPDAGAQAFELRDDGKRILIVYQGLEELASSRKWIRAKLDALKQQPQDGSTKVEVVGQLVMAGPGGVPVLGMVDYRFPAAPAPTKR